MVSSLPLTVHSVGFYKSKGLMREYESATALAEDAKIPLAKLKATFEAQLAYSKGEKQDPFGKSKSTSSRPAPHLSRPDCLA